jgi:hypothetical protein
MRMQFLPNVLNPRKGYVSNHAPKKNPANGTKKDMKYESVLSISVGESAGDILGVIAFLPLLSFPMRGSDHS